MYNNKEYPQLCLYCLGVGTVDISSNEWGGRGVATLVQFSLTNSNNVQANTQQCKRPCSYEADHSNYRHICSLYNRMTYICEICM